MKPVQLTLKGFKGIKTGMGLDEIKVDFTALSGIIVFSAPNGSGKTTILDNMHPFRLMPYRAGNSYRPTAFSYYDHTYGDAEKVFVFEVDGRTYKSKILIDTDRKKAEAFLFVLDGVAGDFVKYPGIDGKLDPYDRAVEEVLGSPELFFTSIFRAQNAKALSDYSKGDIKDLFVELLNISHLQAIGEKARRVKQELAGRVETLMTERKRLQEAVAKEPETLDAIDAAKTDISVIAGEITSREQEIIILQEKINECDVKIGLQMRAREEIDRITAELNGKEIRYAAISEKAATRGLDLSNKATALKAKIKAAEELAVALPGLQAIAHERAHKDAALEAAKADIADVDGALAVMNANLNDMLALDNLIKDKQAGLNTMVQKRLNDLKSSQRDLAEARKQAEYIKSSGCPVDNPTCNLMKAAVAKRDGIDNIECDIAFFSKPLEAEMTLIAEIDDLTARRTDRGTVRAKITAVTETKTALTATRVALEKRLQAIAESLECLPLAEEATRWLPDLQAQLDELNTEMNAYAADINKELVALKTEIDALGEKVTDAGETGNDYGEEKEQLLTRQADHRSAIEEARTREAGHRQHVGALEAALVAIEGAKGEFNTVGARITYFNDEVSQWSTLEKAFGNDGIIALELDDAGPQISAIANELLQVFGGRFSVRIDTQSAKAAGGMKEAFDITVFDNQTDEHKSIKRLSGGEKTWVEDAVTKAICIYNKTASGRQFKTIYTDEKDGALDVEKKKEFFAMKRRVLELGGYDREIAITQSPELMAMADAVIRLSKGAGVEIVTQ